MRRRRADANRGLGQAKDPAVRVRPGLEPMVTQQIARVATEALSPPCRSKPACLPCPAHDKRVPSVPSVRFTFLHTPFRRIETPKRNRAGPAGQEVSGQVAVHTVGTSPGAQSPARTSGRGESRASQSTRAAARRRQPSKRMHHEIGHRTTCLRMPYPTL